MQNIEIEIDIENGKWVDYISARSKVQQKFNSDKFAEIVLIESCKNGFVKTIRRKVDNDGKIHWIDITIDQWEKINFPNKKHNFRRSDLYAQDPWNHYSEIFDNVHFNTIDLNGLFSRKGVGGAPFKYVEWLAVTHYLLDLAWSNQFSMFANATQLRDQVYEAISTDEPALSKDSLNQPIKQVWDKYLKFQEENPST